MLEVSKDVAKPRRPNGSAGGGGATAEEATRPELLWSRFSLPEGAGCNSEPKQIMKIVPKSGPGASLGRLSGQTQIKIPKKSVLGASMKKHEQI